ncbi:hypothetical protein [Actinomadura hibisca]|uniref:hypothetical protein n=1 Tax=Actinomadura hibisca TaxID=68565 RepID=UPI00082A1869|nr:hypothetical protein [Actinomadura hibisca]
MNAYAPVAPGAQPPNAKPRRDPWRVAAGVGLGALIPSTVLAWIVVLSSSAFARCLTYGENCDPNAGTLLTVAWWSFWASAVAAVLAVMLPRPARAVRPPLVVLHAVLHVVTFAAVVASA